MSEKTQMSTTAGISHQESTGVLNSTPTILFFWLTYNISHIVNSYKLDIAKNDLSQIWVNRVMTNLMLKNTV